MKFFSVRLTLHKSNSVETFCVLILYQIQSGRGFHFDCQYLICYCLLSIAYFDLVLILLSAISVLLFDERYDLAGFSQLYVVNPFCQ